MEQYLHLIIWTIFFSICLSFIDTHIHPFIVPQSQPIVKSITYGKPNFFFVGSIGHFLTYTLDKMCKCEWCLLGMICSQQISMGGYFIRSLDNVMSLSLFKDKLLKFLIFNGPKSTNFIVMGMGIGFDLQYIMFWRR